MNSELKRIIDYYIAIHKKLSEEIVGNNDYHIGAIDVLKRLKERLENN